MRRLRGEGGADGPRVERAGGVEGRSSGCVQHAKPQRLPRLLGQLVKDLADAQALEGGGHGVKLARRHAAADQHHVEAGQHRAQHRRQGGGIVAHAMDARVGIRVEEGREAVRVGNAELVGERGFIHAHQLVARGDHGHARTPGHTHGGHAHGSRDGDVRGRQTRARGHEHGTGGAVRAFTVDELSRAHGDTGTEPGRARGTRLVVLRTAGDLDVFVGNDGIATRGQRGAGHDFDTGPLRRTSCGHGGRKGRQQGRQGCARLTRARHPDDREYRRSGGRAGCERLGTHGDAVHTRAILRRVGAVGRDVLAQHPARRGVQRDGFRGPFHPRLLRKSGPRLQKLVGFRNGHQG